MRQQILTITENVPVTKTVYRMTLTGEDLEQQNPGGFINIRLDGLFLRRPMLMRQSWKWSAWFPPARPAAPGPYPGW